MLGMVSSREESIDWFNQSGATITPATNILIIKNEYFRLNEHLNIENDQDTDDQCLISETNSLELNEEDEESDDDYWLSNKNRDTKLDVNDQNCG